MKTKKILSVQQVSFFSWLVLATFVSIVITIYSCIEYSEQYSSLENFTGIIFLAVCITIICSSICFISIQWCRVHIIQTIKQSSLFSLVVSIMLFWISHNREDIFAICAIVPCITAYFFITKK